MQYFIGVSYGHHESSCTLISNTGEIIYIREEWLSRVKNDYRFPIFSLNFLKTKIPNLSKNIVSICLFEKPLKNWLGIGVKKNLTVLNYLNKLRQFKKSDIYFEKEIKKIFQKVPEILYCPHHLSHVYSTEFLIGKSQQETLNIVFDGYGEGLSGAIFKGLGKNIQLLKKYKTESSLGLLYSGITEWMGFNPNEDEYKVMALAAYGKPVFTDYIQEKLIIFNSKNLDIKINEEFFNFKDSGLPTIKKRFLDKFGIRVNNIPIIDQHKIINVVNSFQHVIENIVCKLLQKLISDHPICKQIYLSGGLFHNSKLVGELTKAIDFPIYVSPSPGDAGSSVGAAYFALLCNNVDKFEIDNPYIGPKLESLDNYEHLFKKIDFKDTLNIVKKILEEDEIFAVFSGKCEAGPRALLSRSLCCNASSRVALEKLNIKIKKRESFRPIAPVISKKLLDKYFIYNKSSLENSYWMGQLIWPKPKIDLAKFPFCHKDYSVRAQVFDENNETHNKNVSPIIQELLKENIIIANTSLNIAGDPIVFNPEDLYINCKRLEIKYILQDNYIYEIN